ncbi:MAG: hypothetical protein ACE5EL_01110, partial [Anaerolineae bacterium]
MKATFLAPVLAGAALSGAGSAPAQAALNQVTVLVGGNAVFLQVAVEGGAPSLVRGELTSATGAGKAWASAQVSPGGQAELDFVTGGTGRHRPVLIAPGDTITIDVGGDSTTVRPAGITATADPATGAVAGAAPPGATVRVTARPRGGTKVAQQVTAGPDGRWRGEFDTGMVPFVPGTNGAAFVSDGAVVSQVLWSVRGVEVAIGGNPLTTYAEAAATVTATLVDSRGVVATGEVILGEVPGEDTAAGLFLHDRAGQGVAPTSGTTLTVGFGDDDVRTYAIGPLAMELFPEQDVVSGSAAPGARLHVAYGRAATDTEADVDGHWAVDFTGAEDVRPGVAATVALAGEAAVGMVGYVAEVVAAEAFVAAADLRGVAGAPVEMVVLGAGGPARAWGAGRIGADGTGRVAAYDAAGDLARLVAGDTLDVGVGAARWRLVPWIPEVSADPRAASVAGQAPAGSRVTVAAGAVEATTTAAPDGTWRLPLGDEVDLAPGLPVTVTVTPPGGAPTRLTFPVFIARAQVATSRLVVAGPPGLAARAELERGGDVVATGSCDIEVTQCSPRLIGPGGEATTIEAGDDLLVFPDVGATAAMRIDGLTAHIDAEVGDVVGLSPPGLQVRIRFLAPWGRGVPGSAATGADQGGVYDYEVTAAEGDLLTPGLVADVSYPGAGGHLIAARGAIEVLRVEAATPVVAGVVEPASAVTVTVAGPGGRQGGSAISDADGNFRLALGGFGLLDGLHPDG